MFGLVPLSQISPLIRYASKGNFIGRFFRGALLFIVAACAPTTPQAFQREGREVAKALAGELQKIHSQEELRAALPRLRKQYLRLARLVVAARRLTERGLDPLSPSPESDELFAEMARLYDLPGGRELLASAQSEALKLLK